MNRSFSIKKAGRRAISAVLILASAALVISRTQTTRADSPSPNVAVYELSTTDRLSKQISLHAPGTVTPVFVVPSGQYVTPNGHFAMAMSTPGAYQVWDLQKGVQLAGWASSTGKSSPMSMAVSPNGTYAAISSVSTVNQSDWSVALFNLAAHTEYDFNGTASTTPLPVSSPTLQLQPQIVGWTGDESALILSTGVPFADAPSHLFYKMAMSGIVFTASGTAGTPIPPVTTLGSGQQITTLVFSPDSMRAAFLYEDPANTPVNFLPLSDGPQPLPPNGLKVIALSDGSVISIGQAAAGQGLTAPAWAPDGSKLYFGAGPYQNTPYPVNVHLFSFDFSSIAIMPGDALIASDPAHIGVSDMQVCADQVFMREVSIAPPTSTIPSPTIAGKITSAPISSLATHSDVYTTVDNALGPCVPSVSGSGSGGVVPSVPTVAGSAPTAILSATPISSATPSGPIACILAPQLTVGRMGIVAPGTPNNIRSTPTINSNLIGQIPSGQTFSVLSGPVCDTTSGYVYWQINYNGTIGYTAEGKTTYLVLPYTAPPPSTPSATSTLPSAVVISPTPTFHLIPLTLIATIPIHITFVLLPSATLIPGTCISGYVWREAIPSDHVCVTPATRSQTAADNAAASSRVNPSGAYGPNTCISGYVWREAYTGDVVCVTSAVRAQAAADNAAAASRIAH